MLLCLDVGNSQIYGGVFHNQTLKLRFRRDTRQNSTSDELGIFLRNVLRENNIDNAQIEAIAICSVVPQIDYSLRAACQKYFSIKPFVLDVKANTGLTLKYRNPLEIGADRLANAVAATHYHPNKNILIIDFGTATTFCAISSAREYLGGSIIAGLRISMEALQLNAAKLPFVEIVKPTSVLGRSTVESLQSGLFYGHLGMLKEVSKGLLSDCFSDAPSIVIGTGGFSHLYEDIDSVFTEVMPDLVLEGLRISYARAKSQSFPQKVGVSV